MPSPRDEFARLSRLYVRTHGAHDDVGGWIARIGRIRIHEAAGLLFVDYLPPCAMHYTPVFRETTGFMNADWYVVLEKLRNELILERLADV